MKGVIRILYLIGLFFLISCWREKWTPLSETQVYGLGNNLTQSASNNANYDWYIDQGTTGTYSSINCGPTSVTMAIKWVNKNFALTPEAAREKYRPTGGWWYTSDIINYLNDNSVSNYTISLSDISLLKSKIDDGNVLILCLDMSYVYGEASQSFHVDRFYGASSRGWGHFIVIKGYKVVDGNIFFETYDPFSMGVFYSNNVLKGKDRYYRSANLDAATNAWWDYAIVVTKSGLPGGRLNADPNSIDPSSIQHKSGQ